MAKSKVYFTNFRTVAFGDGLTVKLQKMTKKAGIGDIDMDGKFVAVKMHFGELGNISYLRPNYARAVADLVKEMGGKPFLTDCNTMYPGSRKNALEHLECAWQNGFTPLTVGCPVIIGDGLKGTDDIAVPVEGGEYVKEARIGRAVMDADVFISLTHFKGHEMTGFGGAIKNIGMGCGSRAGKTEQHSNGKPHITPELCRGCKKCQKECANGGLVFDEASRKMHVDQDNCVGCSRCLGACNFDAIAFNNSNANSVLNCKMAEYTKAVVDGRPCFHISLVMDVSPSCDCNSHSDTPIVPNVGIFCGLDPVALDQACADAVNAAPALQNTALTDAAGADCHQDEHGHFHVIHPETCWEEQLVHGERIGLGTRKYELVRVG